MNSDQAEVEAKKWFKDQAFLADANIAWPDEEFAVPDGNNWVRFNYEENDGRQASMGSPGSNRFRQFGIVTIQVFQPQGQGSKGARTLSAAIATALKGAITTNSIHFFNVFDRPIGNDTKGYYQRNVVASFYYDEIT